LSQQALDHAVSICRNFNATLVLAHVVDMRMDYPSIAPSAVMNDTSHLVKSSEELLDKIADGIEGVTIEKVVVTGIPHRELIRIIESHGVNMAVMTTHGRKGLAHALLGSVAEKLARLAPCPVLTVRPKE